MKLVKLATPTETHHKLKLEKKTIMISIILELDRIPIYDSIYDSISSE